jgi:hypothetical protein
MILYLHIGQPKTGSTSIQESLVLNKIILKRKGISTFDCLIEHNHKNLACYCFDDKKISREKEAAGITTGSKLAGFRRKLKNEMSKEIVSSECRSWIISSESLTELESESEKLRLKNLLSEFFSEIVLIGYFRKQDAHILSGYSQKVKSGEYLPLNIPNILKLRRKKYNYPGFIKSWERVFGSGSFIPRIFHPDFLVKSSSVLDFYQVIGASDIKDNTKLFSNQSLSGGAIESLKLINRILSENGVVLSSEDRAELIEMINKNTLGKKMKLSTEELNLIREEVSANNKIFLADYFNSLEFNPLEIKNT